jgi:hypothetical protein
MTEPLLRQLAKGDIIPRHLLQNRGFRASVRQQVDEVEDECAHTVRRDGRRHALAEFFALRRAGDLCILYRRDAPELGEMNFEELLLVRVE